MLDCLLHPRNHNPNPNPNPNVPQLGFMLKMPMPRVLPAEQDQLQSYFNHLELEFQFDEVRGQ